MRVQRQVEAFAFRFAMPAPTPKGVTFHYHPDNSTVPTRRVPSYGPRWGPGTEVEDPIFDAPAVEARHNGKHIGYLEWLDGAEGGGRFPGEVGNIHVEEPYRRHGIATALFDFARKHEPRVDHSSFRSALGDKWVEHERSRKTAYWIDDTAYYADAWDDEDDDEEEEEPKKTAMAVLKQAESLLNGPDQAYDEQGWFDRHQDHAPVENTTDTVWYHVSPHAIPEGTVLAPNHGTTPWSDNPYHGGLDNRANWTWVEHDETKARAWMHWVLDHQPECHLYRVTPHIGPYAWNGTADEGWVTDSAVVEEELPVGQKTASQNADPYLDELAQAGYITDEYARWQKSNCMDYAHALLRKFPHLRGGVLYDDPDRSQDSHYFAHDDDYAYDSLGRHPMPYNGVSGDTYGGFDEDLGLYDAPWEPEVQDAFKHIDRNHIGPVGQNKTASGPLGDLPEDLTFSHESNPNGAEDMGQDILTAHVGKDWAGELYWLPSGEITWVNVHGDHKGRGIGKAMLDHARTHHNPDIHHSTQQTPSGKAWAEKNAAYDDDENPEPEYGASLKRLLEPSPHWNIHVDGEKVFEGAPSTDTAVMMAMDIARRKGLIYQDGALTDAEGNVVHTVDFVDGNAKAGE